MFARLKAWITRRRFERAFAADLKRIEDRRARHAQVRPTQAELQACVHDALARKLSA